MPLQFLSWKMTTAVWQQACHHDKPSSDKPSSIKPSLVAQVTTPHDWTVLGSWGRARVAHAQRRSPRHQIEHRHHDAHSHVELPAGTPRYSKLMNWKHGSKPRTSMSLTGKNLNQKNNDTLKKSKKHSAQSWLLVASCVCENLMDTNVNNNSGGAQFGKQPSRPSLSATSAGTINQL